MYLPTVSRLLRSALRTQLVPGANLSSKPAKHNVTVGEQAIAMTALMVTVLVPSSWILAHFEDYKKKLKREIRASVSPPGPQLRRQ